jgi:hypothetical protein
MRVTDWEHRKHIALCQLDVVIDVLSAWRGSYDDDDRPATIEWIKQIIPQQEGDKLMGWLHVSGTTRQGIGWAKIGGQYVLRSRCGTLDGLPWPVTRKQFREAARLSGVSLPARHATIHLDEDKAHERQPPTA